MKQKISYKAWTATAVVVLITGLTAYSAFFAAATSEKGDAYLYIRSTDSEEIVTHKLDSLVGGLKRRSITGLRRLTGEEIQPGRYQAGQGTSVIRLFRNLTRGNQAPVRVVVPAVRTMSDLAERLARQLMATKAEWERTFADSALCAEVDCTPATLPAIFIPNTYEYYWTVEPATLVRKMKKESQRFWTDERRRLADELGFTPTEVITLASIVDQETTYEPEKADVAAMYINRLKTGMKLQADPTVKFALGDFTLRRILHQHLTVDSPYNTYRYAGLPPGPIAIPQVGSIDAVLHHSKHDYLFMCAKEDFSGCHNFAKTYAEHQKNAARYAEALNRRGIK